jgi:GTP cyclohydrolase I
MAVEYSDTQVPGPKVNYSRLVELGRELLVALGEDPEREGLRETPRRWANFWHEFIEYNPGNVDTTFEVVTTDQMVVVSGIRVWSVCEHHLLPFRCDVSIGYIARDRVLGLSKFARIAQLYAHRPQLQERLVHQICEEVKVLTSSEDVAVLGRGYHLCTIMRGVKSPAEMVTSVVSGVFMEESPARAEFLKLVWGCRREF